MNIKLKSYLRPIVSLIGLSVTVLSIILNIQTCSENTKLKNQLNNKDLTISVKDSLLKQVLNSDSTVTNQYLSSSLPEINYKYISKKIDSLSSKGNLGNDKIKLSKGGYYTKTKFNLTLNDAKATFENDTIAEYKKDNWYLGFNKKTSVFAAQYEGEHEILTSYVPKFSIGKFNFGPTDLKTYKWSNDGNFKITGSETVYLPPTNSESDFKFYLNSEYRQGFGIEHKSVVLENNTSSLYQGIGASYQKGRHGVGIEGNYKLLGNSILPKQELKLKYNFYIIK